PNGVVAGGVVSSCNLIAESRADRPCCGQSAGDDRRTPCTCDIYDQDRVPCPKGIGGAYTNSRDTHKERSTGYQPCARVNRKCERKAICSKEDRVISRRD